MTVSLRTSSVIAGAGLAAMAVLAPLGVMVALPAGATGPAALVVLAVAALDVVVALALLPLLRTGGELLAQVTSALRIVYAAAFAVAAGFLLAPAELDRFQAIWDGALGIFALHLLLVAAALLRSALASTWLAALVAIAGLGYLSDAVVVALGIAAPVSLASFAFIGEVALLLWLLIRAGRRPRAAAPTPPRTSPAPEPAAARD